MSYILLDNFQPDQLSYFEQLTDQRHDQPEPDVFGSPKPVYDGRIASRSSQ